ncbi:MAG: hypothetical protein ACKVPY_05710 [Paracoccaceae bacterium]
MRGAGDIVIGSGPSGVAAASALLARGRQVKMLDGGAALSGADDARRMALAGRDPGLWTAEDREGWQEPQRAAPQGQVRRYGSDFGMLAAAETFEEDGGVALRASHAVGGLTNLWGSAVMPYSPHDMADWPVSPEEMAPHYRAVAELLPIAGRADSLERIAPALAMAGRVPLPPSPQAAALLARLDARAEALARIGVTVGQSRQAVAGGCRKCGQCLHGCPWDLIWKAGQALPGLMAQPGFGYRAGAVVRHVAEEGGGVTVTLSSGEVIEGERLFIGAGVLETARLMLASFPGIGEVTLRDSQQAFLPMLHCWRAPSRPDRARLHTLAQVFAEIDAPEVSPRLVHAQVYSWNEFYLPDLLASYGRLPFAGLVFGALSLRLVVAQVFLHSDHSARIRLRLGGSGKLVAVAEANPDTGAVMGRALGRAAAAFRLGGLVPLTFAARHGAAGASFHLGASFPMAEAPDAAASDLLGRPAGLGRVHLIDASTLPAIPATTITFGVMAHAHRIAALVP